MPAIVIFVRFTSVGWKWPLRAGDELEFWSDRHEFCGTIDAAMLLELLAVHLKTADLTQKLADSMTAPVERTTVSLPEPLAGRQTPGRKAELRERRKRRKS